VPPRQANDDTLSHWRRVGRCRASGRTFLVEPPVNDRTLWRTRIAGTDIAALCCFTPVLVVLLGVLGLSAVAFHSMKTQYWSNGML